MACRAVECTLRVKPQHVLPSGTGRYCDLDDSCFRNAQARAEAEAAAERDWQERVRAGRFVILRVKVSRDAMDEWQQRLTSRRFRGGRPRKN